MDDLPQSLRDMMSQRKGGGSEFDYCMSKPSSGNKSGREDKFIDVSKQKAMKFSSARLNSLEIATDPVIQFAPLSSNNSPNKGHTTVISKPILFPTSARMQQEIKFPDQLSEVLSCSEYTSSAIDLNNRKEPDDSSRYGSNLSIHVPGCSVRSMKIETQNYMEQAFDQKPKLSAFDETPPQDNLPITSEDIVIDTNELQNIQRFPDPHVSKVFLPIISQQSSVSKRIEEVLNLKGQNHRNETEGKEDAVNIIEEMFHKVESRGKLFSDAKENESIQLGLNEVNLPTPTHSPLLPSHNGVSQDEFNMVFQNHAFKNSSFSKKKAIKVGEKKLLVKETGKNEGLSMAQKKSLKNCNSGAINTLISLCNEKLLEFKNAKSRSPDKSPKPRETKKSLFHNQVESTKIFQKKPSEKSRSKVKMISSKESSSPKLNRKDDYLGYLRVKRISILAKSNLGSENKTVASRERVASSKVIKPEDEHQSKLIENLRVYLTSKKLKPQQKACHRSRSKNFEVSATQCSESIYDGRKPKCFTNTYKQSIKIETSSVCSSLLENDPSCKPSSPLITSEYKSSGLKNMNLKTYGNTLSSTPKIEKAISSRIPR